MHNRREINCCGKRTFLFSSSLIIFCWTSGVFSQDIYHEIHRHWPSLQMPHVIISSVTAKEAAEVNQTQTTAPPSGKKTVVFPSPICISLPMAPCFILQLFWRNSSSSVLGVRVPTNRIPSWPRPRERQPSSSHLYKMHYE